MLAGSSLSPDDLSSATRMMAEDLNSIMQEAQKRVQIRRLQPPPPPPSAKLTQALENVKRNIEDYRRKKPEGEEDIDDSDSSDESKDEDEEKPKIQRSRKASIAAVGTAKKSVFEEEEEYYDTSSGMWRMMSAYDDLVLTQPGYKHTHQDDSSWLACEPVPWHIMEQSRNKCKEWLEKHLDTGND